MCFNIRALQKTLNLSLIKERLDRFLANKEWLDIYEDAYVDHLNSEVSDHAPVLLNTAGGETKTCNRPFRFLETWTSDESSSIIVKQA